MFKENRKQFSAGRWGVVIWFALLLLMPGSLFAQVISNSGAKVSVEGAVVAGKDFEISSGELKNDGTVNLNGNFINSGSAYGSGIYRIGGNWTINPGGAFTPGNSLVVFNGLTNQLITRPGGEIFYNLTIANSGAPAVSIGLSNLVTVSNILSMYQGIVTTNGFKLLLSNPIPAALNYTSTTGSRILGKFERRMDLVGTYKFPLGTSANYNPANLIINSIVPGGSVLSEFLTSPAPGNAGLPIQDPPVEVDSTYTDGYWRMTSNGFSSADFSINLNGTGFTDPIYDITRLVTRTAAGNWVKDGTHKDAVGQVVARDNLTGDISSLGTDFALAQANPLIVTNPASLTVCEESSPSFTVTATGAEPLTYRWYHNGFPVNGSHYSGERTGTLTINGALTSDAGLYYCEVRDKYRNTTNSLTATLQVNKIPRATVTNGSQLQECSNVAIDDMVLGLSYFDIGSTLNWTRNNPAGILTAVPLSGTGLVIGDIISGSFENTTDSPITITFQITPVGIMPTLCEGNTITATIIVNPVPKAVPVIAADQICYGTSTGITLNSPTVMTSGIIKFDFNYSESSGLIYGDSTASSNRPVGDIIVRTYRNKSNTIQSVYFTITPKVNNSICPAGIPVVSEVKIHPLPLQDLIITEPLTCDGGGAGLAALSAIISVGTAPYHIVWDGPNYYHNEDIADIEDLYSGRYTVRVSDNLSCNNSKFIYVIPVTAKPYIDAPLIPGGAGNVTCQSSTDGTVIIGVSAGITPPYDYWLLRDGVTTVASGVFPANGVYPPITGLQAGRYTLRIRDFNGCINEKSVDVLPPESVAVTFGKKFYAGGFNVSCNGYDDGSVWVQTITGGNGGPDIYQGGSTEPYTYQWSTTDGTFSGPGNTYKIDNVSAGTYTLTVRDNLGCFTVTTVVVSEPDGIQLISSALSQSADGIYNVSCFGKNDGTITLNLAGGSGIYNYLWTGPAGANLNNGAGRIQSGLIAGAYNVLVTDLNGCQKDYDFTLTQPDSLSISVNKTLTQDGAYNITCYGGKAAINVSVAGGSTGNYSYLWTTTNGSGLDPTSEDQPNLTAGTYNIHLSDINGCATDRAITLTQPQPLSLTLAGTNITCAAPGFDNGSVDLSVAGGRTPYTFLWSNGKTTEDINNLTQGTYNITVTDFYGCSISGSITILLPPPLTIDKTVTSYNGFGVSCYGMTDGRISVTPTSGNAPFVYHWIGPDGFVATTASISELKAGTYTIHVTDRNLCTVTEVIVITQPAKLGMNITLSQSISGGYNLNCAGDKTGTINIEALNSVGTGRYIWSDGAMGSFRYNLPAGNYEVILTDKNNCQTDSIISITQPDSLKTSLEVKMPFCSDMPDGSIKVNVTGGVITTDYLFRWNDNSTISSRADVTKGIYWVSVKDNNSCEVIDTITIDTQNETCLVIPNIFSPNGDFINDEWNMDKTYLYPKMEVTIFNRWGETVWKSESGYPLPWDGRSNGVALPVDSYHYIIDLHNGSEVLIGNVTIVK